MHYIAHYNYHELANKLLNYLKENQIPNMLYGDALKKSVRKFLENSKKTKKNISLFLIKKV